MSNKALHKARMAKNDEFYTRLSDIENELRHYWDHFQGKVVYLNCDDYRKSQFVRYFLSNFKKLGLKKLVASCLEGSYAVYEGSVEGSWDPVPEDCLTFRGDGDFRSPESLSILRECDVVVGNPPFSLFREYVAQLVEYDKKFLILGNMNAITYKEIFPLILNNRVWLGVSNRSMVFDTPDGTQKKVNTCWFTNLDHKRRHEEMILFRRYTPEDYPTYDNYDAINVDKTADIPEDYAGVMGVPITYLDKHNPDQFEILGIMNTGEENKGIRYEGTPHGRPLVNGVEKYIRIVIRNKHAPQFKLLGLLHEPLLNGRKLYKRLLIQRTS